MGDTRGLHLRCRHGQFGWGELTVKRAPDMASASGYVVEDGYVVTAECDLGDHYLRPAGAEPGWTISTQPYMFPSKRTAEMAYAQWVAQEE